MKQTLLSFLVGGMILSSVAFAQEKKISGRVTSTTGQAVPGVTVVVKGTNQATQTDANGNYSLSVPAGKVVLFRSIGFGEKTIIVNNNTSVFNISLEDNTNAIEEVIVTANAIKREKRSLGYSAPVLKSDELTEGRNSSGIGALAGKVAGVNITSTSNSPGSSSRVVLRGGSSISGNNQALIVVDGTPIDNSSVIGGASSLSSVDFGNRGNDINPDDIESVNVLKGGPASALYGSRAANGVILIKTKSAKKGRDEIVLNSGVAFEKLGITPKLQKLYGGGFSPDFLTAKINGKDYQVVNYSADESWGPKLNGQQVLHWDAFDPNDSENYLKTRAWEYPKNDYKTF